MFNRVVSGKSPAIAQGTLRNEIRKVTAITGVFGVQSAPMAEEVDYLAHSYKGSYE